MKPMMENIVLYLISIILSAVLVNAESPPQLLDWTVSFSPRAPLGIPKQVIVINDQFPGPLLNTTTNEVVNVNVRNNLTEPFLITWNGVQMRRNSWQDGVQGTNCPILPGQNWTYSFQVKDQIGSFFYFPSLLLQNAAGGYGPIRVNNREIIAVPFPQPRAEFDVLIGDWYNADHQDMRAKLDSGDLLYLPDGILINGLGPNQTTFDFEPGATYRLRISNVGLKTTLNFRIQGHQMQLVETEGSYTAKRYHDNLDIHVGQSYSVLVTARKNQSSDGTSYYMVASARFIPVELFGVGIIRYSGFRGVPLGPIPTGPMSYDYMYSVEQAKSIRWDLEVGAARPNPQGSFHYGNIPINRTLILSNGVGLINNTIRFTVNQISFSYPDTPLKLADYFQLSNVFKPEFFPNTPDYRRPELGISVIDVVRREYVEVIFQNNMRFIQTWHADGYNFFVVGMGLGMWDESKMATYNMVDAISRSTVQVYPLSWTAILINLDNQGMWNLRSQNAESRYLGQELYFRVKGVGENDPSTISPRDEFPIPENVIRCGRAISA
ncbi:monocopper oxidase-like protein SKS1 [Rhododendron vialii]|uniref:monocopper oxidase-like protein SKS1 n=1 Tax=Rhododendron vialii TaxID=182163 RepID=UPI00265E7466|nr:monocopper oxidase-like protein SKS1 [Rhododendron vialii]